MSKELTLKEAEKIVDDMYQKRWVECGIDDGNTIHMGNIDKLQYTELESASILLLRTEIRLQQENQKLKYNWNKLRETLNNEQLGSILYSDKKRFADIDEILLKMQELEKSDGNE